MGLRDIFSGKKIQSFDQVKEMTTYLLPVPSEKYPAFSVQLVARLNKDSSWSVLLRQNGPGKTSAEDAYFRQSIEAVKAAVLKHAGQELGSGQNGISFDAAFLILREVEEAHLKHGRLAPPKEEPRGYYLQAYRLLPPAFQEALDDLYKERSQQGDILTFSGRAQAASHQPKRKL